MTSEEEEEERSTPKKYRPLDPEASFEELRQHSDLVTRNKTQRKRGSLGNLFIGGVIFIVVLACAVYYYQSYQKERKSKGVLVDTL